MSLPAPRSALVLVVFALSIPAIALGPGCGTPPASSPSPASPAASATSAADQPKPDSTGAAPKGTTGGATATGSGSPASTGAAAASGKPAGNDRLEDKSFVKSNSTGGQYSVSVLSAAGFDAADVGVAIGNASPGSDACYSTFFRKPLKNPGSTVFEVNAGNKGKTQSIKLISDDLKDAELVKCLTAVLKSVHWPVSKEKNGARTSVEWRAKGD